MTPDRQKDRVVLDMKNTSPGNISTKPKSKLSKKQILINEISSLTIGLTTSAIDLVILATLFSGSLILVGPRGKDLYADRKFKNACRLAESIFLKFKNSQFRQSLSRAVSKGLIIKIASGQYQLTPKGQKYARKLIPEYKKPQKWDGQLWLITYDIPEEQGKTRKMLFDYLKEIGCGMIQKSVFLSINDPRKWLKNFVQENNLTGLVITSHLGRDGNIGEENTNSLVSRVYQIPELEKRYWAWMDKVNNIGSAGSHQAIFSYLSILKSDPVLPLELLPKDWIGDKARKIFEDRYGNVTVTTL